MQYPESFDVIVIGGGHAGTEAALAASRAGAKTLLVTHTIETVGQMSCNPAIGGIGKGHIVKEIDALGGIMAQAADRAGIQFRRLNARKGPAVRATRAQADRMLYRKAIRSAIEGESGPVVLQQSVEDLWVEGDRIGGIVTAGGIRVSARAVVLTTGTFLNGRIHVGHRSEPGGRAGDAPSTVLADRLRELCPRTGRLKTGTPPRIDGRTINFSSLELQPGDDPRPSFSFLAKKSDHPSQVCCHIAKTNEKTHDIIRAALSQSALYGGEIEGVGPRYCPSVEDKIVRFADRDSHQIFVEPEGLKSTRFTPMDFRPVCPLRFSGRWFVASTDLKTPVSPGRVMRLNMIILIRATCFRGLKAEPYSDSFLPGRSTAQRAMKKPPGRGWLRVSTQLGEAVTIRSGVLAVMKRISES